MESPKHMKGGEVTYLPGLAILVGVEVSGYTPTYFFGYRHVMSYGQACADHYLSSGGGTRQFWKVGLPVTENNVQ